MSASRGSSGAWVDPDHPTRISSVTDEQKKRAIEIRARSGCQLWIAIAAAMKFASVEEGLAAVRRVGRSSLAARDGLCHSGIAASWCPICGDCTCPREEDGEPVVRTSERATIVCPWPATYVVHDSACPLHGKDSAAHCSAGDPPDSDSAAQDSGIFDTDPRVT